MEDKKLARVFDRVKLSPEREEAMLADLLREKREASDMKNTENRKHRMPAAALVAAALVVVLAGTAVAAGYSGRLDVTPVGGDFENGYNVRGAYQNIPAERLSEEVLERAAQAGKGNEEFIFDSWSEAEDFLGLEIADNALLEAMPHWEWTPHCEICAGPEDVGRCTVRMNYSLGLPDLIYLHADYFEETDISINVSAYFRAKGADDGDSPFTLANGSSKVIDMEDYVTPSGLNVTIFTMEGTVTRLDGTTFQQPYYAAYFTLNDAMFELTTTIIETNSDTLLSQLKEVLDAYE